MRLGRRIEGWGWMECRLVHDVTTISWSDDSTVTFSMVSWAFSLSIALQACYNFFLGDEQRRQGSWADTIHDCVNEISMGCGSGARRSEREE